MKPAVRQLLLATRRLPPYLGFVGTHGAVPTGFAAVNKQIMTRSRHVCRAHVSRVQLIFANWQGEEAVIGGNGTITASIEYPAGTFIQATFSGATSGTVIDGSYIVSDPINVSLAVGAVFFVRSFYTNAIGIPYTTVAINGALGEACTFAASGLTDQTMSGTVSNTGGGIGYPCVGIIGQTTEASFLLIGDSRMQGINDSFTSTASEMGEVARSIGSSYSCCNAGISGAKAQVLATAGASSKRAQLAAYCSHVISQFGINDLTTRTAAQLLGDMRTIQSLYPGKKYFACTIAPRSTSTDSYATVLNQTADAANAQRISYNNTLRAGVIGFNGFLEIADPVESSRDSGLWKAPSYTTDGLHESQTANLAIVSSGNINAATLARS